MATSTGLMLSGKAYDVTKYAAQIVLPAVATLYFALAQIWNLAGGEQVVGTITAVDTFLGILLGISSATYNASESRYDGNVNVLESEDGAKTYQLELNGHPDEIDSKKDLTFKVKK